MKDLSAFIAILVLAICVYPQMPKPAGTPVADNNNVAGSLSKVVPPTGDRAKVCRVSRDRRQTGR